MGGEHTEDSIPQVRRGHSGQHGALSGPTFWKPRSAFSVHQQDPTGRGHRGGGVQLPGALHHHVVAPGLESPMNWKVADRV